jgi:hypothetical protein
VARVLEQALQQGQFLHPADEHVTTLAASSARENRSAPLSPPRPPHVRAAAPLPPRAPSSGWARPSNPGSES